MIARHIPVVSSVVLSTRPVAVVEEGNADETISLAGREMIVDREFRSN